MNRVLVTDGRAPAALAVVRSLGSKGIDVHCGEGFRYNLSAFSKHCAESLVYPSPDDEPTAFLDRLTEIVRTGSYDMVIPVRDSTTRLLSKHRARLEPYTELYLADHETISTLDDKAETIKIARDAGVRVPPTYFPEETPLDRIKAEIEYPALVRARRSSGSRGIEHVESLAAFDAAYSRVEADYGTPMIQECISKTGYSTACILLDESQEVVASFSYERRKEYPLSGGPTVVGVSTDDTAVKSHARELLQEASWHGVAEVEFILDETGTPRLLEVNPRFWTPLQLAISSGVDFPYLIWKLANGDSPQVTDYDAGVTYRWLLPNEILWALETSEPKQGVSDLIEGVRTDGCYTVLSANDPIPVVGTVVQSLDFLRDPKKRAQIFDRGW